MNPPRQAVSVDTEDVGRAYQLFVDVKRSAQYLMDYQVCGQLIISGATFLTHACLSPRSSHNRRSHLALLAVAAEVGCKFACSITMLLTCELFAASTASVSLTLYHAPGQDEYMFNEVPKLNGDSHMES